VASGPQATKIARIADELTASEVARVAEFRAALRRFLRTSERNAWSAGLTPQRYLLLLMIKGAADHSEQSTVTELAQRLQLAQSTVTELVSRAEEIGLVERERSSDDGRIAHLRLTPEGERRLAESFTSNASERAALRDAFAHLDEQVSA
jgi:DNA-binding MarR family transcriptional regulator